jgi:hypothetical protein
MPNYSVAASTVAAATVAPYAALYTGAAPIKIQKISLLCQGATLSPVRIYRAATLGTPTSTAIVPVCFQLNEAAALESFHTAWAVTAPTISTNVAIDGAYNAASISAGYVLVFDFGQELEIAASSALILWNPSGLTGAIQECVIRYRR